MIQYIKNISMLVLYMGAYMDPGEKASKTRWKRNGWNPKMEEEIPNF